MLVEMRAVKVGQAVLVGREMRGHPVQDDTDTTLMQVIDEIHEILRRAEAAGRCEIPCRLVAPRAVEGMLRDGQKLHVCEAQFVDVIGERLRHFAVAERAAGFLRNAPPRAHVHLIDRHGRLQAVALVALLQPERVVPFVLEVPHDGRGARRYFPVKCERVRLVDAVGHVARGDVILVVRALPDIFDVALPHTRVADRLQRMRTLVPAVKIANQGNALRVGRPDGEVRAAAAFAFRNVRAQLVVEAQVRALVEQVDVLRPQQQRLVARPLPHGYRSSCARVPGLHQTAFVFLRRSFSTISSSARSAPLARSSSIVYFRRRRQLGRSWFVPGTFCGSVSSHRSSRLSSTMSAGPPAR